MRSRHQRKPIVMVESFADVLSERVPGTSGTDTPPTSVVWVAPQQIAHRTLVRHFLYPVERADVVQRVDTG
jgi:hypothetical protein